MKLTSVRRALLLSSAVIVALPSMALDWPQWQGPSRNAMSKETGLLQEWSRSGPPLAWRINDLGGGYLVIANGKLYLRDQDLLLCYNVKLP